VLFVVLETGGNNVIPTRGLDFVISARYTDSHKTCLLHATYPQNSDKTMNSFRTQPISSRRKQEPEDADQVIVQTDFGIGVIVRTRKSDGIKEIRLGGNAYFGGREPNMLYTPKDYQSVPPCVGDDVICQYGRGVLKEIADDKYTIELASWRLSGRSTVTCHVTTAPKVVRKHTLSEMDSAERVDLAKSQKAQAAKYFAEKDFTGALNTYASAVDKVRNVQHDHTSSNEVRADLVVIMITCSNNAATCCIKLAKWEEASKFATNALILLDALYGKRGMKIHTILKNEGTIDAKLFGEWRIKSYLVVARSCMEQGEVEDAIKILKKARGVGMPYIDAFNSSDPCSGKEEKASLRALTSQMKEIKRLIAEYSEKKRAAKKIEKKKAKVMAKALFGSGAVGKENATPDEDNKVKNHDSSETKQHLRLIEDSQEKLLEDQIDFCSGETTGQTTVAGTKPPLLRKSSLKSKLTRENPTVQQSVSFSDQPPQVKEFDRAKDDDDDSPWQKHKEALILLGLAGFSVLTIVGLRRAFR